MSLHPSLRACGLMLSGVLWLSGCGSPPAEGGPSMTEESSAREQVAEGGGDVSAQQRACPEGPAFQYASRDPVQCLATDFLCQQGQTPFFNECGCGCTGRPVDEEP